MTVIKECTTGCKNAFQDKEYNGKRVMNEKKAGGYNCTVCGKDFIIDTKKKK